MVLYTVFSSNIDSSHKFRAFLQKCKLSLFSNYKKNLNQLRYPMSYARQLLYSIADQLGRSRKDMDPFIGALQKNWFDTKDAMRSMTQKDFDRLDFPARLSGVVMQKIGTSNQIQPQKQVRSQRMQVQSHLAGQLNSMRTRLSKSDFDQVIKLLGKIFANIRDNVTQPKYRTLKRSNDKILKLTSIAEVQKVLFHGGFQCSKEGYTLTRINLSVIDECIQQISHHEQKVKFNPYEQKIISLGQSKMKYQGQTSVVFNDMLAEQKKRRQQIMSRPVKDREIKVFQVKPQNIQRMQIQFNQKQQMNQDQKIYNQTLKQKLKNYGKEAEFMNKRKQQYYELLKQPLYTETIVRVKLPDNWIFQCRFSPSETLQALVDTFHENLESKKLDYYLYMTPPVQKLRGAILRQSFYQLGCIPRATFHFKCEEEIKGNFMKTKKNSTFGFFS